MVRNSHLEQQCSKLQNICTIAVKNVKYLHTILYSVVGPDNVCFGAKSIIGTMRVMSLFINMVIQQKNIYVFISGVPKLFWPRYPLGGKNVFQVPSHPHPQICMFATLHLGQWFSNFHVEDSPINTH